MTATISAQDVITPQLKRFSLMIMRMEQLSTPSVHLLHVKLTGSEALEK